VRVRKVIQNNFSQESLDNTGIWEDNIKMDLKKKEDR
jgi:hypothetical protein